MLFAIGDVHGCADELRRLLNRLPITPESTVVFLGDYVDRGPASRQVIETVLELAEQCTVVPLMGNHEELFLQFLDAPASARAGAFILNGGGATLASYADARGEVTVPAHHEAWLRQLPLWHETPDAFFVHAGVPERPLAELEAERDRGTLLWTRGRFLSSQHDWGRVIVHGHTPVERATLWPNRINIDTGCVYQRRLTAISLPGEHLFSVHRTALARHVVLRDLDKRRAAVRFRGTIPVQVRRGDQSLAFLTVDYSELGMYLRAVDSDTRLDVGDRLDLVVAPGDPATVAVQGVVVRRRADDAGTHYAVKILVSPAVTLPP